MRPHGRPAVLLGAAFAGGLFAGGVCAGAEPLVVVHDAGGTVPAAPYVERPALTEERVAEALQRARARLVTFGTPPGAGSVLAFPVSAAPLAWLTANAAALRSRGAQGFLVRADGPATLHRVRRHAARLGLMLDPLPGAALAEAFGASSYPFVAEPAR